MKHFSIFLSAFVALTAFAFAQPASNPRSFPVVGVLSLLILLGGPILVVRNVRGEIRKPLGGILTAIGAFLVIFAIVRINSVGAQLASTFGRNDDLVTFFFLLGGIPCVLTGVWMLCSPGRPK